jgi:hypothetical protein
MKKLSRCLWSGVAAVSLLSLAGCGGKSELESKLVGSWKTNDTPMGTAQIMDYNDDGTATLKMALADMDMQWKVVDNSKIKYWATVAGEDKAITAEIQLNGDTMTERDVDGGATMTYTRVPDGTDVTDADDKPLGSVSTPAAPATPLSDADRSYIQMYTEVLTHIHAAEKAIDRYPIDSAETVLVNATKSFDAAWSIHVKHFNSPPRFHKTDETLRLGLKKWSEGLESLRGGHGKDEILKGVELIEQSKAEYEKQTGMLLGKN